MLAYIIRSVRTNVLIEAHDTLSLEWATSKVETHNKLWLTINGNLLLRKSKMSEQYNEGYKAFQNGYKCCLYPLESKEYYDWWEGFEQAEQDELDKE